MNPAQTMNEKQMDRLDSEAREQRAASELAPSEPQAPSARSSVADCSLWVSAGLLEQLVRAWERGAHERREAARKHGNDGLNHSITDALYDQAQTMDDCANELHLLLVDATVRQPTENS